MDETLRQPAEWREKALEYWDMSKKQADYDLREQYAELAARYLDMAESLEDRVIAKAVLGVAPKRG